MKTIALLPFLFLMTVCFGQDTSVDKSPVSTDLEFKWNFLNFTEISYEYSFEVNSESTYDNGSEYMKAISSDSGELVVKSMSEDLADITLQNVQNETTMYDREGGVQDSMSNGSPNETVSGLTSKGTFQEPNHRFIYDLLFSLPEYALSVGESSYVSMSFPFNANGYALVCKGENVIKFKEFADYEGKKCAVLKAVADISDLGLDESEKGKYVCSILAKSTYYFDLESGNLVGCTISFVNNIQINTLTGSDDVNGMSAVSKEVGEVQLKFKTKK